MKKLSSSVLCGVVMCVAMLAGCVTDESGDATVDEDGIQVLAEADQDEGTASDVEIAATQSFRLTCIGADARSVGIAIISASASSCRRRDGSWTGPRGWSGFCLGDVSNNDGIIGCF